MIEDRRRGDVGRAGLRVAARRRRSPLSSRRGVPLLRRIVRPGRKDRPGRSDRRGRDTDRPSPGIPHSLRGGRLEGHGRGRRRELAGHRRRASAREAAGAESRPLRRRGGSLRRVPRDRKIRLERARAPRAHHGGLGRRIRALQPSTKRRRNTNDRGTGDRFGRDSDAPRRAGQRPAAPAPGARRRVRRDVPRMRRLHPDQRGGSERPVRLLRLRALRRRRRAAFRASSCSRRSRPRRRGSPRSAISPKKRTTASARGTRRSST